MLPGEGDLPASDGIGDCFLRVVIDRSFSHIFSEKCSRVAGGLVDSETATNKAVPVDVSPLEARVNAPTVSDKMCLELNATYEEREWAVSRDSGECAGGNTAIDEITNPMARGDYGARDGDGGDACLLSVGSSTVIDDSSDPLARGNYGARDVDGGEAYLLSVAMSVGALSDAPLRWTVCLAVADEQSDKPFSNVVDLVNTKAVQDSDSPVAGGDVILAGEATVESPCIYSEVLLADVLRTLPGVLGRACSAGCENRASSSVGGSDVVELGALAADGTKVLADVVNSAEDVGRTPLIGALVGSEGEEDSPEVGENDVLIGVGGLSTLYITGDVGFRVTAGLAGEIETCGVLCLNADSSESRSTASTISIHLGLDLTLIGCAAPSTACGDGEVTDVVEVSLTGMVVIPANTADVGLDWTVSVDSGEGEGSSPAINEVTRSCVCDTGAAISVGLDMMELEAGGAPPDVVGEGAGEFRGGGPAESPMGAHGTCGCGSVHTDSHDIGTSDCLGSGDADAIVPAPSDCSGGVADFGSDSGGDVECKAACLPPEIVTGVRGHGGARADADGGCVTDPTRITPGACGYGFADTDSTADGAAGGSEADPALTAHGLCGGKMGDARGESGGAADGLDACSRRSTEASPGTCGACCDTDPDAGGIADCREAWSDASNSRLGSDVSGFAHTGAGPGGTPVDNGGCVRNPAETFPGVWVGGVSDRDSDTDGEAGGPAACNVDAIMSEGGTCGGGSAELDTVSGGAANCRAGHGPDPAMIPPGLCGYIHANADSDPDGAIGCQEVKPVGSYDVQGVARGWGASEADLVGDGNEELQVRPAVGCGSAPGVGGYGFADIDFDSLGTAIGLEGGLDALESECGVSGGDAGSDCLRADGCSDSFPINSQTFPGGGSCRHLEADSGSDDKAGCPDGSNLETVKCASATCGSGLIGASGFGGATDMVEGCDSGAAKLAPCICMGGHSDVNADSGGVIVSRGGGHSEHNPGYDSAANYRDGSPADARKSSPEVRGRGVADTGAISVGVSGGQVASPSAPPELVAGVHGGGDTGGDSDPEESHDYYGGCVVDPSQFVQGCCGGGHVDTSSDATNAAHCLGGCDADPLKTAPRVFGCVGSDAGLGSHGTAHGLDASHADSIEVQVSVADTDSDPNQIRDRDERCVAGPAKIAPNVGGCGYPDTVSPSCCMEAGPSYPREFVTGLLDGGVAGTDSHPGESLLYNGGCGDGPAKIAPDVCGCGDADTDPCAGSAADDVEAVPAKPALGLCGGGIIYTLGGAAGSADCLDTCSEISAEAAPGMCGSGYVDTDSGAEGIVDYRETCSDATNARATSGGNGFVLTGADFEGLLAGFGGWECDPGETLPGVCGCSVSDGHSDHDGDCPATCNMDPILGGVDFGGCGSAGVDYVSGGATDCRAGHDSYPARRPPDLCEYNHANAEPNSKGSAECQGVNPAVSIGAQVVPCGGDPAHVDRDGDGNEGTPMGCECRHSSAHLESVGAAGGLGGDSDALDSERGVSGGSADSDGEETCGGIEGCPLHGCEAFPCFCCDGFADGVSDSFRTAQAELIVMVGCLIGGFTVAPKASQSSLGGGVSDASNGASGASIDLVASPSDPARSAPGLGGNGLGGPGCCADETSVSVGGAGDRLIGSSSIVPWGDVAGSNLGAQGAASPSGFAPGVCWSATALPNSVSTGTEQRAPTSLKAGGVAGGVESPCVLVDVLGLVAFADVVVARWGQGGSGCAPASQDCDRGRNNAPAPESGTTVEASGTKGRGGAFGSAHVGTTAANAGSRGTASGGTTALTFAQASVCWAVCLLPDEECAETSVGGAEVASGGVSRQHPTDCLSQPGMGGCGLYWGGVASRLNSISHRPSNAANGVRFGEAANPGHDSFCTLCKLPLCLRSTHRHAVARRGGGGSGSSASPAARRLALKKTGVCLVLAAGGVCRNPNHYHLENPTTMAGSGPMKLI